MMTESGALNRLPSVSHPATAPMPDRRPSADHPADRAALAWLTRRHSGHWTVADEESLAAWLAADAEHPAAWQRAEALWHELAGLRPFAAAELHARHTRRAAPAGNAGNAGWRGGLAFAGIGVLAFGLAIFWLPGSFAPAQIQQTARGEQRTLTLADGSRIELNTATQLQIDYGLGCRCITLVGGEAVFRVAHGDPRRFVVKTRQGQVRDIGTEFWLRDEPAKTAVAVLEGEIEVAARPGAAPTRLLAGERQAWDRDGRPLDGGTAPLADLLAWREGALVFRDAPLTDVVAEFARYHAVGIDIDARLQNYRLSGRLPSADLDGLLKLIEAAYPVKVRRLAPERLRIEVRAGSSSA
jgi:transmembrane sensor